jgi:diguanylate cyclase (GGDEF)-like protein
MTSEARRRPGGEDKVLPNGDLVAQRRREEGWTQEDLAQATAQVARATGNKGHEVGLRTLQSIERGGRRFQRARLEGIGKALGVPVELLILHDRPAVIETELVVDRPLAEAEQAVFLGRLAERLGLASHPRLIARPSSSVVAILGLSPRDANQLMWLASQGQLVDLGVGAARIVVVPEQPESVAEPPLDPTGPQPRKGSPRKFSLLLVDDEPHVRRALRLLLQEEFDVREAESADQAESCFAEGRVDLILTDQRMPGRAGVQLLEWVREHYPETVRLLITGHADVTETIDAVNRGHIYHYFTKPWPDDLVQVLRHAAEKFALERERRRLMHRLKKSNRELRRVLDLMLLRDPLTRLYNAQAIEEFARIRIRIRHLDSLSLGLVAVDQLAVPEAGPLPAEGKQLVGQVADVLTNSLRSEDGIGWLDHEFLIVAPRATAEGAGRLTERIRKKVASSVFRCNNEVVPVTISIGMAVAGIDTPADFEGMRAAAAAALAQARAAGGNRCEVRRLP